MIHSVVVFYLFFGVLVCIGCWHMVSLHNEFRRRRRAGSDREEDISDGLRMYRQLRAMKDEDFARQDAYYSHVNKDFAVDRPAKPVYTEQEGRKFRD